MLGTTGRPRVFLAAVGAALMLGGIVAAPGHAAAPSAPLVPTAGEPDAADAALPPQRRARQARPDSCAALREDLPRLARAGERRAACISPAADQPASAGEDDGRMSAQVIAAPSWCATGGYFNVTRTASCGVFNWTLTVYNVQTGAVLGQINFNTINYSYSSTSTDNWGHQLSIHTTSMWGQVSGTTVSAIGSCLSGANCVQYSSNFPPQSVAVGRYNEGDAFFRTTATAPGARGWSRTRFTFTFANPTWANPASGNEDQLEVRCDNALPGVTRVGCVFTAYTPTLVYSMNGPFPVLAQHIRDAQASGLPGAYPNGTPLRRLTDPVMRDRNRATACPSSYPRPPGFTCDEYPFASTYQGAYLSGGGPRTFPYCAVVLVTQSTGPNGYSVCMIESSQNSGGGSALGFFYNDNRVLDNDPFRVYVSA